MKEFEMVMPKKGFRLEKEFTTYFNRKLKDKGFFVHKLSDGGLGSKPYDCIIRTNIATYHTEIKVIDKENFYIKQLRSNQRKALRLVTELGGVGLIVIYSKHFNKHKVFTFEKIKDIGPGDYIKLLF